MTKREIAERIEAAGTRMLALTGLPPTCETFRNLCQLAGELRAEHAEEAGSPLTIVPAPLSEQQAAAYLDCLKGPDLATRDDIAALSARIDEVLRLVASIRRDEVQPHPVRNGA